MIFLPALLFGVPLLLLRRTDTIFSFFRRKGKGGKEEDQEERMFLLLGAAVLRRTKGVLGGFTVARETEGVTPIFMSSKRRKKKCRKFLDDFESFFFVFFVRDLSFFLSFLKRVLF